MIIRVDKVLQDIEVIKKEAMGTGDYAQALQACKLQGQHLGMFSDRVIHQGSINTEFKVEFVGPDAESTDTE